jgi:queuine tRNA-ribosyltransferase
VDFRIIKYDSSSKARAAVLKTAHGVIQTPIFMPVGTQATVKTISPLELNDLESQIILNNTYHLYLRPGQNIVKAGGGVQKFMGWNKPILTDSGGYQVFSLADLNKITPDGFKFQSHVDGSRHFFSPEKVVEIQRDLGSDIMMVLDECAPYPCDYAYAKKANNLTIDWAQKSKIAFNNSKPRFGFEQSIFAILQGSTYEDIRRESATALVDEDFPGYAIGGLSVGEPKSAMYEMTSVCTDILPVQKPRYLMGVGKPEDLLEGIENGIDMFDCILPTRMGRNGTAFTAQGTVSIKNAKHREAFIPLEKDCNCYTCKTFSRAYLRHLYMAKELLVLKLLSYHNLYFYIQLMKKARKSILGNNFQSFKKEFLSEYFSEKE